MKVYIVMGGMDYEGFSPWTTMEVFETREAAEAYSLKIITEGIREEDGEYDIYDFSRVFEKDTC